MTTWNEYGERSGVVPEWPYPIRYNKENEITADVLLFMGVRPDGYVCRRCRGLYDHARILVFSY
jgi:hypothetical protein